MTNTSTVDGVKSFSEENVKYIIQTTKNKLLFSKEHTHTFYELIFVLSGNCLHNVCGDLLKMQSGDFIIIRPLDYHAIVSADQDTDILCISLSKEEYLKYELLYGKKLAPRKNAGPQMVHLPTQIQRTLKILLNEDENYTDHDIRAVCAVLFSGCADVTEETLKAPHSLSVMMQKMRSDILLQKEGVSAMTRIAGYSISQLTRLMKIYYDTTPHEYLKELRLLTSRKLVTQTNISLEAIAYECGYSCYGYFTDIFKKRYGKTPAVLRKSRNKK